MKNKIEKEERLLTEEEKKYVIDGYNKIRWSNFALIFGLTFIIYVLLGLLWGLIWWSVDQDITMGLRQGFGLLFFITGITSIWIIYYFLNLQVVIKKIKANRMYVKEAIYEKTSGKYNRVYLQMYKKGKLRYSGYHLLLREPLNKGDKVIVLQMRGRAWVYKVKN